MGKLSGKSIRPHFIRRLLKRVYWKIAFCYQQIAFIEKYGYSEFGKHFRFERAHPYKAYVGDETITDNFNIWNAEGGDINIGSNCWLGLHNIVMGPIIIGDNVSTGPYVSFLGPRHAILETKDRIKSPTKIGNHVWISTGSIILFGISIGDNAIIGPGSVVTNNVPEKAFFLGNPARNLTHMFKHHFSAGNSG
jgi:acetyltransferase-like isoleucine patch superfamily enzyme